jgi:hypothetical protein
MTNHLDWWPEGTTVSADDIVVAGVSLRRLVDVCGTPAVHSGSSVSGASVSVGNRRGTSTTERTAVLVTRVLAMTHHRAGCPVGQVDARLGNLRLIWSQARRVGGTASRTRTVLLVRNPSTLDLADADDVISVSLPANLRAGDLLAIPSRPYPVDPARPRHPLTGRAGGTPESIFDADLQLS